MSDACVIHVPCRIVVVVLLCYLCRCVVCLFVVSPVGSRFCGVAGQSSVGAGAGAPKGVGGSWVEVVSLASGERGGRATRAGCGTVWIWLWFLLEALFLSSSKPPALVLLATSWHNRSGQCLFGAIQHGRLLASFVAVGAFLFGV